MNAVQSSNLGRRCVMSLLVAGLGRTILFGLCSLLQTGWGSSLSAQTTNVEVTMLNGDVVAGEWRQLSLDKLVVSVNGKDRVCTLSNVAQLRNASSNDLAEESDVILLVDGTRLRWNEWRSDRKTFSGRRGDQSEFIVAADMVQAIRRSTTKKQQWADVLAKAGKEADAIVVQKGEQLDWVDAVIRQCSSEEVRFSFQGREVQVSSTKTAGLIFFQPPNTSKPVETSLLLDRHGQSWTVANWESVESGTQVLRFKTACGVVHELKWSEVKRWDFADLRMLSISSRDPDQFVWQPLVPIPGGDYLKQWNAPRRNQGFDGAPIRLLNTPDANKTDLNAKEELMDWILPTAQKVVLEEWTEYSEGVALRAGSEVTYQLDDAFQRLTGTVGLAPPLARNQEAKVKIYADQTVIFAAVLDASDNPTARIDAKIEHPSRIILSVQFAEENPSCDSVNFGQLRLLK